MGNITESSPLAFVQTHRVPKIIGLAFNYLKQGVQGPPNPVVFLKSWSSISYNPSELRLPLIEQSKLIHELQLGVMMKSRAFRVKREDAMSHVGGYFILLDITDTSKGKPGDYIPQTMIKSQDNFCPVSPPIQRVVADPYAVELQLKVNGETRQKDFVRSMYFKIDVVIEYVSQYMGLNEGDLILTGTPLGAGPLKLHDRVEGLARLDKETIAELKFTIVK